MRRALQESRRARNEVACWSELKVGMKSSTCCICKWVLLSPLHHVNSSSRPCFYVAYYQCTIGGPPIDTISCMIFSTPNSHSCHIGSFSGPVNTHWEPQSEFVHQFCYCIDKMSRPPLPCSEPLTSSCKLVYGRLRCLGLSMNFFKSN